MKKLLIFLLILILTGCNSSPVTTTADRPKLKIVTTLFPQYDFVRQLAGDKAELTLLLHPGADSHTFEPTPQDIIKINNAGLFIYTGEVMEPWAKKILDSVSTNDKSVNLDLSKTIPLEEEHDEHEDHSHVIDPHFFTNPNFSKLAVNEISTELCRLDPDNSEFYKNNTKNYIEKLDELDKSFREISQNKKRDKIVFGGRFSFHYFVEEYGFDYISAYDSCAAEADPTIKRIHEIIIEIEKNHLPVVYHEELTDPKTAASIATQTNTKLILLHSCHNISKDDMEKGVTYLDLMNQNVENLKEGLY